jgi:hypothetical protein
MKSPYTDKLDADKQITAEELIASSIALVNTDGDGCVNEEAAAELGRDILYLILRQFRPDLFDLKYVIHSKSEDGYWNNDFGWTSKDEATAFTEQETKEFSLPQPADSRWEKINA